MLKFHDDPMVNESEIVIFLDRFGGLREKERVLGRRKGKNEIKRQR